MPFRNADFQGNANLSNATIAVYGLGKMGLPLAAVLADYGATVIGVDIDDTRVEAVNEGNCPVLNEPDLPALIADHGGDSLRATTDGMNAAKRADVMIVLVPTVIDEDHRTELGPVLEAASDIQQGVGAGDLIVLESTVPPGTTEGPFVNALEPEHLTAGEDFGVVHGPERTSSGRVVRDLTESYPKILGGLSQNGVESAASLYRIFNDPGVIKLNSTTAAEAVKVFEGVYRDVNIALANELGKACEEWGLDAFEVFEAANSQPYCDIHTPGIGVGGHCIPVYPHFVINRATKTPLLETARQVNDGMPAHAVTVLESLLHGEDRTLEESRVLVLGITYRAGVREIRYAPALDVIDNLTEGGAEVLIHDPLVDTDEFVSKSVSSIEGPLGTNNVDAVVLATGHEEYGELNLEALRERMRTPILVDGRNFFDSEDVDGFTHAVLGDGTTEGSHSEVQNSVSKP